MGVRSSKHPTDPRPRDAQLDGLRGVAILMVVVYHATWMRSSSSLLVRAAMALPWMGWSGVDLFFVLSGFLITRILVRERGARNYFAAFYARRVLRIFPLYYALAAFCLAVVPAFDLFPAHHHLWVAGSEPQALWYWVFLGNFRDGLTGRFHHSILGVTWSLAIEEHFYLVWPQLVARLSTRDLEVCCAVVAMASLVLRVVAVTEGASWLLIYIVTPFRLDALAVGSWIALRSERDGGFASLARINRRALPIALGAVVVIVAILVVDPGSLIGAKGSTMLRHPLMQTVGYTALAATAGGVLVKAMTDGPGGALRRFLGARALRSLGKISYALYLFHLPVITLVTMFVFDPRSSKLPHEVALLVFYAAVLVPAVAASQLSWWALESRVLALRRRVPFRHGS